MFVFDIELAAPCNAKCDFCPQSFKPTGVERDVKFLDEDLLVRIMNQIKDIAKSQPRTLNRSGVIVDFCGMGENLLRKDLLLKAIKILTKDRPPKLDIRLTTNGFLLREELVKNPLFKEINQIEISTAHTLDKDKYEAIYNLNYDVVLNNIMNLRKHYPGKIVMATVRVKQLKDDMNEWKEFWSAYSDDFLIHDFHTRGNEFTHPNPDKEKYWRFDICGIFRHFIYISSDGLVLPCCNDVRGKHPVGDLRKESILSIIERKKEIQKLNKGYDICVGCDAGELMIKESDTKDEFDMPWLEREINDKKRTTK